MPVRRAVLLPIIIRRVSGVGVDVSGVGFLIHDIELSRGLWVLDRVILGWLRRERGVLPYPGAQNGAY